MRWLMRLLRRRDNRTVDGYRTIIYPAGGEPVVVRDTLMDCHSEVVPTVTSQLSVDTGEHRPDGHALAEYEWGDVNPATGLPMLFWGVDIEGNPYGLGAFRDEEAYKAHLVDDWTSDGAEF